VFAIARPPWASIYVDDLLRRFEVASAPSQPLLILRVVHDDAAPPTRANQCADCGPILPRPAR